MRYIITDIDHTISDAAWRDHLLGFWDVYYTEQHLDPPHQYVLDVLMAFNDNDDVAIVAVTARPESVRGSTLKWLRQVHAPVDMVLMRPEGDHRPSREVKVELIKNFIPDLSQVICVFEDRPDCVAAYQEIGLNVFLVNHGKRIDHGQASQSNQDGDGEREADRLGS